MFFLLKTRMSANLSIIDNGSRSLILDASVLINLIGSHALPSIISSLNGRLFIEEVTFNEITYDPRDGNPVGHLLSDLINKAYLKKEKMNKETMDTFYDLIGAPSPDDLGDGEAATIALAVQLKGIAVIDDKKALRIASKFHPSMPTCTTLDIFTSDLILNSLGPDKLSDALFMSIKNGRMRVPHCHKEWTIKTIGIDRATQCLGLKYP